MKKILAISAALALMATAGTAMAAGTAYLPVTANVAESCTIEAPNTLNFGDLDPYSHPLVTTDADVNITCTSGVNWTITDPDAATPKFLTDGGTGSIAYSVSYSATTGNGTGDVTVTGTITSAAYGSSTPTGVYNDTITLSVSP